MKNFTRILTLAVVASTMLAVPAEAGKQTKGGGLFGFSSGAQTGGHAAYPDGTFPTIGQAAAACGGADNVAGMRDESDEYERPWTYFCAEL